MLFYAKLIFFPKGENMNELDANFYKIQGKEKQIRNSPMVPKDPIANKPKEPELIRNSPMVPKDPIANKPKE